MKIVKYPEKDSWRKLLKRPAIKEKAVKKIVKPIIKKVKQKGDKALRMFAFEYDHVELHDILINDSELKGIEKKIGRKIKDAID